MQKKINIISLTLVILTSIIYGIIRVFGIRPIFVIEKIFVIFILFIIAINTGIYLYKVIKKSKILNVLIGIQIEVVLILSIIIIIKNMNVNIYKVQKGENYYLMRVNVNDNSKEYYLYKNDVFIISDCAIKEYLSNTSLSYEENTPVKIEYNKEILPNESNKTILETQKKIIECDKLDEQEQRVVNHISTIEQMQEFCDKYSIENIYDNNYFITNDVICISYIPFKEVIPYVAYGEDNNCYVYIKEDSEDTKTQVSFCFIQISKKQINDIIILDYNDTMKNKIV